MNGVHDLGGADGFGPVRVEPDAPVFHADWERRVFGVVAMMIGRAIGNVHRFRHAIERMEPLHYLGSSYYEHWLTAVATLAVERGLVTRAELERHAGGRFPLSQPVRGEAPAAATPSAAAPRFALGATVRVRNEHPQGHTRCPRYVRDKLGVVVRVDPAFELPDVAAHADRPCDQFQYCVRFAGRDLWGDDAEPTQTIHVDLSEGYLEAP